MTTRIFIATQEQKDAIVRRAPCPSCDPLFPGHGCPLCFGHAGTVSVDSIGPSTYTGWEVGDTAVVMVEARWLTSVGEAGPPKVERCQQTAIATARVAEVLPVVGEDDEGRPLPGDGDYVRLQPTGRLFIIGNSRPTWDQAKSGEREWAPEFDPGPFTWEPGMVALRLTDVVELDPPVVEMAVDTRSTVARVLDAWDGSNYYPERVPLSATEGQEVTLP